MAEKIPYQKETPFLYFLLLSVALNIGVALSGYYFRFPERTVEPDIELSAIDANDVPPVGEPDAAEQVSTPSPPLSLPHLPSRRRLSFLNQHRRP